VIIPEVLLVLAFFPLVWLLILRAVAWLGG
jgi:hypothetical protein